MPRTIGWFAGIAACGGGPSAPAESRGVAALFADGSPLLAEVWRAESSPIASGLGGAVASAGDVDGDGFDDVIAGAPFHDGSVMTSGGAFVYLGSEDGLATTPAWTVDSGQETSLFGGS